MTHNNLKSTKIFHCTPNFAIVCKTLSILDVRIFTYMYSFWLNHRSCFAKPERIAQELHTTTERVSRAMGRFVKEGYFTKERKDNQNHYIPSRQYQKEKSFTIFPTDLFFNENTSKATLILYSFLSLETNTHNYCKKTIDEISNKTNLSIRTIKVQLNHLKSLNCIKSEQIGINTARSIITPKSKKSYPQYKNNGAKRQQNNSAVSQHLSPHIPYSITNTPLLTESQTDSFSENSDSEVDKTNSDSDLEAYLTIDASKLEQISEQIGCKNQKLSRGHLYNLHKIVGDKLKAKFIQDQIDTFTFGLTHFRHEERYKRLDSPIGFLMFMLKTGQAWIEPRYKSTKMILSEKIQAELNANIAQHRKNYYELHKTELDTMYRKIIREIQFMPEHADALIAQRYNEEFENRFWPSYKKHLSDKMLNKLDLENA